MKALTISQPYASLIADGKKFVENRVWFTSYRGPLAIHAGKGTQYLAKSELSNYPSGCIIAVARLSVCVNLKSVREDVARKSIDVNVPFATSFKSIADILAHEHTEGPYCWVLDDIRKLAEPIPCRGAQGLWEWKEPATGTSPG